MVPGLRSGIRCDRGDLGYFLCANAVHCSGVDGWDDRSLGCHREVFVQRRGARRLYSIIHSFEAEAWSNWMARHTAACGVAALFLDGLCLLESTQRI